MLNIPTPKRLSKIPKLYETEYIPAEEKMIHLHFFLGGCDWFIAEFDGEDTFFCFAILNGDWEYAEWGYASFQELKELRVARIFQIDCELEKYWKVRPFSEVIIKYAPKEK